MILIPLHTPADLSSRFAGKKSRTKHEKRSANDRDKKYEALKQFFRVLLQFRGLTFTQFVLPLTTISHQNPSMLQITGQMDLGAVKNQVVGKEYSFHEKGSGFTLLEKTPWIKIRRVEAQDAWGIQLTEAGFNCLVINTQASMAQATAAHRPKIR